MSHLPYRFCLDINKLFQKMFPDSSVANDFPLSKNKCAYTVHFGIAPYFKSELLQAAKDSLFHSILFDESLNSNLQQCQMDVHVRFWDLTSGKAISHYLTSQFPNAANLWRHLNEALDHIPPKKMTTLSMDGPSVSWFVFRQLNESRLNEENWPYLKQVFRFVSCSLFKFKNDLAVISEHIKTLKHRSVKACII